MDYTQQLNYILSATPHILLIIASLEIYQDVVDRRYVCRKDLESLATNLRHSFGTRLHYSPHSSYI